MDSRIKSLLCRVTLLRKESGEKWKFVNDATMRSCCGIVNLETEPTCRLKPLAAIGFCDWCCHGAQLPHGCSW